MLNLLDILYNVYYVFFIYVGYKKVWIIGLFIFKRVSIVFRGEIGVLI